MSATAQTENPAIEVDADGRVASWDGQTFTGDTELVQTAVRASETGEVVEVFGFFPVQASAGHPVRALAALMAHSPGRTLVTRAPREVTDWLDEAFRARDAEHGHEQAG